MDDITPLQQMNQTVLDSKLFLFDSRQAVTWRTWNNKSLTSDKVFYGQNPPNGGIINFYLKDNLADRESVSITIQDSKGTTIRTQNCTRVNPQAPQTPAAGPGTGGGRGGGFGFGGGGAAGCTATKGINRWVWDLRTRPITPPTAPGATAEGAPGGPGGGFGFGGLGAQGFRVDPGDYTVKIKLGDTEITKTIKVIEDPRVNFSAEDRAKKRAALNKLQPLVTQAQGAATQIVGLKTNLNTPLEAL